MSQSADIATWSEVDMKKYLSENGIEHSNVHDKTLLRELVRQEQAKHNHAAAASAGVSAPAKPKGLADMINDKGEIVISKSEVKELKKTPDNTPETGSQHESMAVADKAGISLPLGNKNVEEVLLTFFPPEQMNAMVEHLKNHMVPAFLDQMRALQVPPIRVSEPEADIAVQNLAVSNLEVQPNDIDVQVKGNNIHLAIKHFTAELKDFDWQFKQKGFPYVGDSGKARAGVKGGTIDVAFDLELALNLPPWFKTTVKNAEVKIDTLDIHVSESYASWLYNTGLALFNSRIKQEIANALSNLIRESLQNKA